MSVFGTMPSKAYTAFYGEAAEGAVQELEAATACARALAPLGGSARSRVIARLVDAGLLQDGSEMLEGTE